HGEVVITSDPDRAKYVEYEGGKANTRKVQDKRRRASLVEENEGTDDQPNQTNDPEADDRRRPSRNSIYVTQVGKVKIIWGGVACLLIKIREAAVDFRGLEIHLDVRGRGDLLDAVFIKTDPDQLVTRRDTRSGAGEAR